MQTLRELLTGLGVMAAHPGAFGILIVYAVLWFILTEILLTGMPVRR